MLLTKVKIVQQIPTVMSYPAAAPTDLRCFRARALSLFDEHTLELTFTSWNSSMGLYSYFKLSLDFQFLFLEWENEEKAKGQGRREVVPEINYSQGKPWKRWSTKKLS